MLLNLVQFFILCVFVLLSVAFFSLFERKLMGLIQFRKAPNKVSVVGILQPMADAIKLVSKVESSPYSSIKLVYFFSPVFFFFVCFVGWVLFPSKWVFLNFGKGILVLLILYSLSVYGVIFSGWFSNSKYALLGSGRALAQSISYEVGLTTLIIFFCIINASSSLEYFYLEGNMFFPFFFVFILMVIVFTAELNRSPFDLSEGESELVSGYSVEYGGLSYTLIFLAENSALIWGCLVLSSFFMKQMFIVLVFFFVWVRASVPRIRFDKMMYVFWLSILPISMNLYFFFFSFF